MNSTSSNSAYNHYQQLASNVCEIVEPEVHINNHLSLRAYDIPKYDCKKELNLHFWGLIALLI
jgi:hypothetical protein